MLPLRLLRIDSEGWGGRELILASEKYIPLSVKCLAPR